MEIRFKLNPRNEKDKVIIDVLGGEYSPTDTIKSLLYKIGTSGLGGITMSFGGYVNNVNISSTVLDNPHCNSEKQLKLTNNIEENQLVEGRSVITRDLDDDIARFFS